MHRSPICSTDAANVSARQRWNTFFRDNNHPADIRTALRSEQGDKLCEDGLRSICWKACARGHYDLVIVLT